MEDRPEGSNTGDREEVSAPVQGRDDGNLDQVSTNKGLLPVFV